jgi:hypothetical protein
LFGDGVQFFLGEHAGLCDLLGFAIRFTHRRSNTDCDSCEPALLGHFYPPAKVETILYPKCLVEPTKSEISVQGAWGNLTRQE